MKNKKVLICYNAPVAVYQNYSGKPLSEGIDSDDMSETQFSQQIASISAALNDYYSEIQSLAVDNDVRKTIRGISSYAPDVIFNLVESVEGIAEYEAYLAGIYDLLQIPFTGNTPICLGNCLHKFQAKQLLASAGLHIPAAMIKNPDENLEERNFSFHFPVITKLLKEDASIGISENSVVYSFDELQKQLAYLDEHYHQPVLIEEYIEGREFNIAILGKETLPISEISFDGLPDPLPKIVTYEGKWIENSIYYKHTVPICPAELSDEQRNKLYGAARIAFDALQCRDYARIDIRLSGDIPYVIEVNPNPDISSDAGFARAAGAAGYSYPQLLNKFVELALERA